VIITDTCNVLRGKKFFLNGINSLYVSNQQRIYRSVGRSIVTLHQLTNGTSEIILLLNIEKVIQYRKKLKAFNTVLVSDLKMIHTVGFIILMAFILISSGATTFLMANGEESPNALLVPSIIHRRDGSIMTDPYPMFLSTAYASESNSASRDAISSPRTIGKLDVVTSVSPITSITKNVGGDRIDLTGLVPEGVNSHTFELVPSDVIKINNADLVIINGLGLESNLEEAVFGAQGKNPTLQILKLGDNTISPTQWEFDFSFPKEKGDPNPHLWLNVAYAIKFANLIRDKLTEMDPQNAAYYSENTKRYISLLKKLDEGILQAVQTIPPQNRKLLTYHDSWAYFATRYNMRVVGAVQPSDFGEPTPRELARLIDQIKSERIPAIFASEVFPTQIVNQIAKESDAKIVETLSDDDLPGNPGEPRHSYVGMMLENMKSMLTPLGGNITSLAYLDPRDTYLTNGE
jgi:ABC-type Zn uptake system ZnuABC Zn-binding protein ZnuA